MRYEGGCLCGALRYVAEGTPINQRICHCRLCQKALGAAFNARLLLRADDVRLSGPAGRFHSSPALERGFCRNCGTTVFSARQGAGLMGLTAGSLDDPGQFRPDMHFWTSSRQPWLRFSDGLPQYLEGPPA
ncbi:GFA family protein [Roseomonas sp. GCM10028921]